MIKSHSEMSRARKQKSSKPKLDLTKGGFVRKTVTIHPDHWPYVEGRMSEAEHAGNLSSYLRKLFLGDGAPVTNGNGHS